MVSEMWGSVEFYAVAPDFHDQRVRERRLQAQADMTKGPSNIKAVSICCLCSSLSAPFGVNLSV